MVQKVATTFRTQTDIRQFVLEIMAFVGNLEVFVRLYGCRIVSNIVCVNNCGCLPRTYLKLHMHWLILIQSCRLAFCLLMVLCFHRVYFALSRLMHWPQKQRFSSRTRTERKPKKQLLVSIILTLFTQPRNPMLQSARHTRSVPSRGDICTPCNSCFHDHTDSACQTASWSVQPFSHSSHESLHFTVCIKMRLMHD